MSNGYGYGSSGGGGGSAGKVLQVVDATSSQVSTSTIIPNDDVAPPQNTEGGELMTLAITPLSATSKLYISFSGAIRRSVSGLTAVTLFVDSDADALATTCATMSGTNHMEVIPLDHPIASGSTTARTYKIRFGPTSAATVYNYAGTADDFGGTVNSTLTITEVEA